MQIRPARPQDQAAIAQIIARAFAADFAAICRDPGRVAKALAPGVQSDRFFVAERGGQIVGVAAVASCQGRAMAIVPASYRRHLGFLRGVLAAIVLREEFAGALSYPPTTGYIEFVAVADSARRQGVATALLQYILRRGGYADYLLDVTDVNTGAQACYRQLGFTVCGQVAARHPRQMGFSHKIYMRRPADTAAG